MFLNWHIVLAVMDSDLQMNENLDSKLQSNHVCNGTIILQKNKRP